MIRLAKIKIKIFYLIVIDAKGMSKMSNSIDLKPYNVDMPDQITDAQQIEAEARMKIKENSELTESIIQQMILNKSEITDSMIQDINKRAEHIHHGFH